MKEFFAKRNKEKLLENVVDCAICKEEFKWTEGLNADVVVDAVNLNHYPGRTETSLSLKVTAKCPNCNYKAIYNQECDK